MSGAGGAVPGSCLHATGCFGCCRACCGCLGGISALQVHREQFWSAARKKITLACPVCLAQCECGACNLLGKVAFLKMSSQVLSQNTTLKYQPVAMKLSSSGVTVGGARVCALPSPADIQPCNLKDHFSLQTASLRVPCTSASAKRGVTAG